jgi:hypothetical protein
MTQNEHKIKPFAAWQVSVSALCLHSKLESFHTENWKDIQGVPTMEEKEALLEQGKCASLDNSINEESDMKRKGDDDEVKTIEPKKKRGTPMKM